MYKYYKKKPVVIQALEWTGDDKVFTFIEQWSAGKITRLTRNVLSIPTLEGDMKVPLNNFIIRGVNGEFYSCDPEIFEKTYEQVTSKDN